MGRMDGNGVDVEIADPRGRIAQLELEVQRLERANSRLQDERDKARDKAEGELERLRTQAEQDTSVVGRGYRSVTVYADGTVEVDRSFDDDDQPVPSRRAL